LDEDVREEYLSSKQTQEQKHFILLAVYVKGDKREESWVQTEISFPSYSA
jgi:hypothetical protein